MNNKEYALFTKVAKPGVLFYLEKKDIMGILVRFGQGFREKTWLKGLNHNAFVDSNNMISESTIIIKTRIDNKFPFIHIEYASGIYVRPLSSWKHKKLSTLVAQKLQKKISDKDLKVISGTGYRLQAKGLFYPVRELVGTLLVYLVYSFVGLFRSLKKGSVERIQDKLLNSINPLNSKRGMYCSAYVNHCYESAGIRILPKGIKESVSSVCDMYRTPLKNKRTFIINTDNHKEI